MKHVIATASVAVFFAAQSAWAGGLSDPIVEEPVVIEETVASSGDILIPILFLVFGAAVATN